MSQLSCLASSSPCCWGGVIVAVSGRTHLLFKLTFFNTVLESGASRTTELSLMMSSVICMSSKRNPDYESDTEMYI